MEQFPDNHRQTIESQKTSPPQVVLPDVDATIKSVEITSEQIEANIDRLLAEEQAKPVVAATNFFDALAYAKLSSSPSNEPPQNLNDASYGAADPYVNPAELNPAVASSSQLESSQIEMNQPNNTASVEPPNATAVTLDEILKKLPNYEPEPETSEPEIISNAEQNVVDADTALADSADQTGPTVEVIDSSQSVSSESTLTAEETGIEELPPVAWFAESIPPTTSMETKTEVRNNVTPAIPLAAVNLDSGEPLFDVRDFSDSAHREIAPIPGSYDADPDAFETSTIDDAAYQAMPTPDANAFAGEPEQVFAAGEGDVIEINGSEGFDYIDLTCFDVNSASFSDNVISINDEQGTSFEIRHKNVSHATFAAGVEISLSSEPNNN